MSSGRRFGGEGMRRGMRNASPTVAAAEESVTLDDLYARHTWLWWWDGAHGVDTGADTWTDRVGSYVLTASGLALTETTLGGQPAVRAQGADGSYMEAPGGPNMAPMRMFVVASSVDVTGATVANVWQVYSSTGGAALSAQARAGTFDMSYAYDDASGGMSERSGAAIDDGAVHVVRLEYNTTNASHVLRIDGAARGAGTGSYDASIASGSSNVFGAYVAGAAVDMRFVAAFACAYSAIDGTQAAQVETDLLTIMGL